MCRSTLRDFTLFIQRRICLHLCLHTKVCDAFKMILKGHRLHRRTSERRGGGSHSWTFKKSWLCISGLHGGAQEEADCLPETSSPPTVALTREKWSVECNSWCFTHSFSYITFQKEGWVHTRRGRRAEQRQLPIGALVNQRCRKKDVTWSPCLFYVIHSRPLWLVETAFKSKITEFYSCNYSID